MELVGGVGALFKVDEPSKTVRPVATFLDWYADDSQGRTTVYCKELFVIERDASPPFHVLLVAGESLYLGDSAGKWSTASGDIASDKLLVDDFTPGEFIIEVGYIYQRIPPFMVSAWKKTVLEEGQLYEAMMIPTNARLKQGLSGLDPLAGALSNEKIPIGKR